jgi:hypothetical protein
MTDESLQDNPFAAPSELVHAALTEATDDWYEVRGETVVCRSSLRLPMYCLVTGAACPGAALVNFQLVHAPRFSLRRAGTLLTVVFAVVVWIVGCVVVGGILSSRGAPTAVIICFAIAGIGIPVAALIVSSRSSSVQRLPVTAFLSPGRRRARNWISWLPVAFIVPLMALDSMGVLPRGLGGFWFVPFLVFNLISQRTWLRGMQLKMRPLDDGLHEITGFSAAFLARLKEHSDATGKAAQ